MYGDVSAFEKIISGQDVYDRVEELRDQDVTEDPEECGDLDDPEHDEEYCDACNAEPETGLDEDERAELESLETLLQDLEYVGGDARHVTMVRYDHFAEWVKEQEIEINGEPEQRWAPYVDWEAWTDDQRSEYTEIDWDGCAWLCYGG